MEGVGVVIIQQEDIHGVIQGGNPSPNSSPLPISATTPTTYNHLTPTQPPILPTETHETLNLRMSCRIRT